MCRYVDSVGRLSVASMVVGSTIAPCLLGSWSGSAAPKWSLMQQGSEDAGTGCNLACRYRPVASDRPTRGSRRPTTLPCRNGGRNEESVSLTGQIRRGRTGVP